MPFMAAIREMLVDLVSVKFAGISSPNHTKSSMLKVCIATKPSFPLQDTLLVAILVVHKS